MERRLTPGLVVIFLATQQLRCVKQDCEQYFVTSNSTTDSSTLYLRKNNNCEQFQENNFTILEYCKTIPGFELSNEDDDILQLRASFEECIRSGNQPEYFASSDGANTCKIHPSRDNIRVVANTEARLYIFRHCPVESRREVRDRATDPTRILISVICVVVMVILLTAYVGLMFYYRCFNCKSNY